ncbi:hypothetical protein BGX34_005928 [Mortierella sp. NVP85]|nr:hypothetical protein BGX34_005928 [Mortierella sp. NVP85]
MPSSDMFLKIREPTPEGDKLGFVKLMVAGKSRVWHSRLIQDIFKWDGIIANDFEDEFLQGNRPSLSNEGITAAAVAEHRHIQDAYTVHAAHDSGSSQSSAQHDESPQERRQERYHGVTETIVERYASSMVLPAWARSGLEGQELQQEILVKNICFVDTPGYSSFRNHNRAMDLAVSYLGLQFQTTNEFFSKSAASDDSLGRFLANNATGAHSHVDLCLYIIEGQLLDQDIVFMQRLQPWVNLVPILIPLDAPTHSSDPVMPHTSAIDVTTARQELIRQLRENNIEVYGVDDEVSRTVSSAGVSGEDDLSPPPLSLDGHSLYNEYTCPPFVFYVPKDVVQGSSSESSLEHEDIKIPVSVAHASSSSLDLRHEPLPDLSALRRWVFVDNLAALRHLTTLKFLRWRRHAHPMIPSPMYSSQESSSLRPRQHFLDDQSPHSSASDHMIGSLKTPFPAPTANNHLSPTTGPLLPHQQSSPTEAMGHLISQDRRRITENVVKMLETHRQVFERIMLERQETWRLALEGMEREQRIDFLVQELKRCAMSGHSMPDNDQSLGETELSSSARGHVVGLGMEAGMSRNSEPSLRDALGQPLPSTSHLVHNRSHYRGTPHLSPRGKKDMSSADRSSPNWPRSTRHAQDRDAIDELDGDDPLGLGMWMGQLFRAIGRGIIQVVVMVGMGSFATWIYRHYLENNPMLIGQ